MQPYDQAQAVLTQLELTVCALDRVQLILLDIARALDALRRALVGPEALAQRWEAHMLQSGCVREREQGDAA